MLALALAMVGHPVHPSSDTQGMVPIPRARPSMHVPPVCKDLDSECLEAAARGACKTAAEFMLTNCRLSSSPPTSTSTSTLHPQPQPHPHLLQVVMRSLLDGRDADDVPCPQDAAGTV